MSSKSTVGVGICSSNYSVTRGVCDNVVVPSARHRHSSWARKITENDLRTSLLRQLLENNTDVAQESVSLYTDVRCTMRYTAPENFYKKLYLLYTECKCGAEKTSLLHVTRGSLSTLVHAGRRTFRVSDAYKIHSHSGDPA